jgi:hypothetical protein
VTYDFQGEIGSFRFTGFSGAAPSEPAMFPLNLPPGLNGGWSMLGQTIRGSITVDADAGVDELLAPDRGRYGGFDVISAFSLSLNGFDFTLDTSRDDAIFTSALITNIDTRRFNTIDFRAGLAPGSFSGLAGEDYLVDLSLSFTSFDLNVINSGRLPADLSLLGAPFPGQIWSTSLFFSDLPTGNFVAYDATFANVTRRAVVPAVSTSLLFGLGALMLVVMRRRSTSRAACV